ncbi:hypothetical protein ACFQS2_11070 [Brachybacterium sp. GCM10030267]|uniref:hypothetical protein n=1 Tax=Brachybacterium sp. GCM10030267 TaxID=3273381 RepID=UPI00361F91FB
MNINFGVAALSGRGRQLLPALWEEALRIGGEAYDLNTAAVKRTPGRASINARALDETWEAPTWLQDEHGALSLSQPPISFQTEIAQSSWHRWALDTLREDPGRRTVHPGYFGISHWENGGMEMWNDIFGFARAYVVTNDHFAAVGNHIGMVSMFSATPLKADEFGADVFAQLGFWPEENSPLTAVRRLGAAEVVAVGTHDEVSIRQYGHLSDHFEYRERHPDIEEAAHSLAISTANIGAIMSRRPRVDLSGGRDSRLTAAAWIAGGRPGLIHTLGNLQGEADIAVQLVEALGTEEFLEGRGLKHQVVRSDPRRAAGFSIEERIEAAMRQWDGDFAHLNLKSPIVRPPRRSAFSVGGGNGEVMHPLYYSTPHILKSVRAMEHPLRRVPQALPPKWNTVRAAESTNRYIDGQVDVMCSIGQLDATALNVFQMMAKFRRWPNSQLVGSAFVLLLNPVFVRAAIDMTPEQRVNRELQDALTVALVPQWSDMPYFKGGVSDFKNSEIVQANRIWNTSPGSMEYLLHERDEWKGAFDEGKMLELEQEVHAETAATMHESTLNKAFVVDAIPEHAAKLERRRERHWSARP